MANLLFTNSSLTNSSTEPSRSWTAVLILRRLVLGMALLTLFLMALGSATRVMNAGLACPDWPLCYGTLVPRQQMNLQVFLEWFHRLIASSLGLLTLTLTGLAWAWRRQLPNWLPAAASFSLFLVILQGVLGGLTVTELLRFDIVTAHLGTGLLFFTTLLTIGLMLLPYQGTGVAGKLPWFSLTAAVLVYLQSLLGGLVASQWALHQCLNGSRLCGVMNSHLLGIVPASLATLVVVFLAYRRAALHPLLRRFSQFAFLLLGLQLLLGYSTFRLQLHVPAVTVAHQFIGATLLGKLVAFTVIGLRDACQARSLSAVALDADSQDGGADRDPGQMLASS